MKITLENTSKIVEFNGIPVRIWEGETESGIKIHAYIPRVAVNNMEDQSQFMKELKSMKAPSKEIEAIPFRMIV